MTSPVDPFVVRKLADCIELLPRYINNPQKMPFVQEVVQRAFEQIRRDREALAQGYEASARSDELRGQLSRGKNYSDELGRRLKYNDELAEDLSVAELLSVAEKYREPVTSVWLSDSDREALKDGFDKDETGIFEGLARLAADVAECVKECLHPRDAELFRSRFSFVCGEELLLSKGVEVSPGVYKLDLSIWEAEGAKPFCDYLREVADEMEKTRQIVQTETEPGSQTAGRRSYVTVEAAESTAKTRWKELKNIGTKTGWAKLIGCSTETVEKLPSWDRGVRWRNRRKKIKEAAKTKLLTEVDYDSLTSGDLSPLDRLEAMDEWSRDKSQSDIDALAAIVKEQHEQDDIGPP